MTWAKSLADVTFELLDLYGELADSNQQIIYGTAEAYASSEAGSASERDQIARLATHPNRAEKARLEGEIARFEAAGTLIRDYMAAEVPYHIDMDPYPRL